MPPHRSFFYGFVNVASTVVLPPAVTVIVRCQGVISSFSIETWCSPGVNCTVDGVLPMYFPSTFMSQPEGVDFTVTLANCIADRDSARGSVCALLVARGSVAKTPVAKASFPEL